jgi:trk system potassium uptake protein TrkH
MGTKNKLGLKQCGAGKLRELLARLRCSFRSMHPAKLVMLGYLSYVLVGWVLLCLPFAQAGQGVGPLDNLFMAASAVSTTGLVTVSTADSYSPFGQAVILLLIQLGGIGYMTLGSFVILARTPELPRLRKRVGQVVFSLPESFRVDRFVKSVMAFTLIIETCGAIALYAVFRTAGEPQPLWSAVFHSVSAFCTAGFSLHNDSFEGFADNFWLNSVIATLSYLGAIGFIVCVDFWRKATGKTRNITLTSKIILHVTLWLSVAGTLLLFLSEPSIQSRSPADRLMAAFFQAMTAITTVGFNTIPVGQLSKASVLLVILLMVIGSSPSGTGGGLKCTTFSALIGVMFSAARGEREVRFWGRPIPIERIWTATATLGFYLAALVTGTWLLELTEASPFDQNLFEAASALGTVGLSRGITSALSTLGKVTVILLMFCGRLGPLTFGMAFLGRKRPDSEPQDNDLAV